MDNLYLAMGMFAFVGAVTPGPVNLLATTTAANQGKRAAAMHVTGASVAYGAVVFISATLIQQVGVLLPSLTLAMQLVGSLFLLYLAFKIGRQPVNLCDTLAVDRRSSGLWVGAVTQLINPKAWLVAMSGASLFVVGEENEWLMLMVFTSLSLVICGVGVGIWAILGQILSRWLEEPTRQKRFNLMMAGLLSGCVVLIWF